MFSYLGLNAKGESIEEERKDYNLWEKRILVLASGFIVIEGLRMVVDEALISIVMLLVSAVVGWLFARIDKAHDKVREETKERNTAIFEIMRSVNNKMNKDEVRELVDSRVNPLSRDISEIKIDIKTIVSKMDKL